MFFADQLLSRYPGVEARYIQQDLGKDRSALPEIGSSKNKFVSQVL